LLSHNVAAGARIDVPLYASFLTGTTSLGDSLTLKAELSGWNSFGENRNYGHYSMRIPYRPWSSAPLPPLAITAPNEPSVSVLAVQLEDDAGTVLNRNFTSYVVEGAPESGTLTDGRRVRTSRVSATAVSDAKWSLKQWNVFGDAKFNGAGSGYVEYRIPWPKGLRASDVASATFLVEASAKRLNGKDRDTTAKGDGDYMRGGGLQDRSLNPNSYPMTSVYKFPSAVTVRVNDEVAGRRELADDPADSRGILSWNAQRYDGTLTEAGSYGELLRVSLGAESLAASEGRGEIVVRMEVSDALPGGLAIYGARFGRYPLDPTVLFVLK
jgi:hypothetical protein